MTTPTPVPDHLTYSKPFDPTWPHGHVLVQDGRRVRILWTDDNCYVLCVISEPNSGVNNCPYVITREGRPVDPRLTNLNVKNKPIPYDGPTITDDLLRLFAANSPCGAHLKTGLEAIAPALILESFWFKQVVSALHDAKGQLSCHSGAYHEARLALARVEEWRRKFLK